MGLGIPKPKPRAVEKMERDAKWKARDDAESEKVKIRSGGRCEVTIRGERCRRRAFQVHHHIGGWRLRGRGDSALAKNKTHACVQCHNLIEKNVYTLIAGNRYASHLDD